MKFVEPRPSAGSACGQSAALRSREWGTATAFALLTAATTRCSAPYAECSYAPGKPVGAKYQNVGSQSQDRSPDLCKLPAGLTMGKLMIASTIVDVAAIIAFGAAVSLMAMTFSSTELLQT